MTAIERVRSTRLTLGAAAFTRAIGWGAAATLGILAGLSFLALAIPSIGRDSTVLGVVALGAGMAVMGTGLWRSRHLRSTRRVALWIEEKIPDLHYDLVTALENEGAAYQRRAEETIRRQDIGRVLRRTVSRTVVPALVAGTIAASLLYVSPSRAFGGGAMFFGIAGLSESAVPEGSRLVGLTVRVTPPAYVGQRATTLEDPASVVALVGSRVTVLGSGPAAGITGLVGTTRLSFSDSRGEWLASFIMPSRPAALRLLDRDFERIVVLETRTDNPPRIVLTSPERDSTLRSPRLVLRLNATATDDIGLNGGYFEYLITTGSGEIFSARTMATPVVRFRGAGYGSLAATLDLASLKLAQGDVVSIRAITQDLNTLSGPGLATSDTRTFRIARADEYDSVAVDAAGPLPIDSSAMSQRMLIMMTEQLVREETNLTRQQLVKRSGEIGDLEDKIRKRVHSILFEQDAENTEATEDAEASAAGPETEAHSEEAAPVRNSDLLEAYNALWEAVRALQIAEPAPALPPMRVALKALDRARLANRLYLRGLPPKIIVDLARVRMTGKEKGSGSARTPRTAADSSRARLERSFGSAIELIESKPADAIRVFTLLQVDALSFSPSFASAVGEAVEAFRKGRDATLPLVRARRALSGNPAGSPGLPSWSGGW